MSLNGLGFRLLLFRDLFSQLFRFIEELPPALKAFTGGTELFMLLQPELLFVPRQLCLQLNIFKLKGFKGGAVWRSHRIHAVYYPANSLSFALGQVMAIQAAGW